jgi:hypothetical protein
MQSLINLLFLKGCCRCYIHMNLELQFFSSSYQFSCNAAASADTSFWGPDKRGSALLSQTISSHAMLLLLLLLLPQPFSLGL